jgi:hypothetical protein
MSEQRTSSQHIAAIKEGIQNLNEETVRIGLGSLYNALKLEHERDMPLSPLFDLVTTMPYGREDFLSLEIKNLLALFIFHMVQRVYSWDQHPESRGVLQKTKEELLASLAQLADLLNAAKEPCVTAVSYIETARQLVATLSMSKEEEQTEFGKILSIVRETTPFANTVISFVGSTTAADLGAAVATHGASLAFNPKTLKLIYDICAEGYAIGSQGYKMFTSLARGDNKQEFVLQLYLVDSWKKIVLSQVEDPKIPPTEIKETLETLKKYFETVKGGSGKPAVTKFLGRQINKVLGVDERKRKRAIKEFRISIADEALTEIDSILKNIDSMKSTEQGKLMPLRLRKIAFRALVDWYVTAENIYIKCEILRFFGEVSTLFLFNSNGVKVDSLELGDNALNRLVSTTHELQSGTEPETGSDSKLREHIEVLALMFLIATVSPSTGSGGDYWILGLISDNLQSAEKDVQSSEKAETWQLQCTAVEALLRFDYFYRSVRKPSTESPIARFLEEVGQEYRLVKLFVGRLGLTEKQVDELRVFIGLARQKADLVNQREAVKSQALQAQAKASNRKGSLTEAEKNSRNVYNTAETRLRDDIGPKLRAEREKIEKWLKSNLGLEDGECNTLLEFLKENKEEDKGRGNGENELPYSGHDVRPVLDKLINKFDLNQAERELIDKVIFRGKGTSINQVSWREWLAEAFKSFVAVDHYPKIACTFNNLGKIKAMIEEEEKTKGRFTA